MQVFEYYGQMSENGQLNLPDELKKQLKGYAEEDKIYDDL